MFRAAVGENGLTHFGSPDAGRGGNAVQIVFLNRLNRIEGMYESSGQVFIGESQGTWTTGWRDVETAAADSTSAQSNQTIWYEGVSWEELLAAFRHGVAVKMKEGYRPIVDGMLETPMWEREPSLQMLVQCYADQIQADAELEGKLKQWRRAKSVEEKKSAYYIATNRELHLLAVFLPRTLDELGQIPGFGLTKTEKYGAELCAMLKDIPRQHAFPLTWVSDRVDAGKFTEWIFRMKEEKYGKELAAVREKKWLLAAIREGKTLSEMEAELPCSRRKLVEWIERLDDEGYDVLPLVEAELTTLPPEEWAKASDAMAQLGDRYLKPLLRQLYGEAETSQSDLEQRYLKLRMMRIRFRRERQSAAI